MTSLREPLLPREGDWTVDDLADLPDDGLRYELLDGVLLVSAAASLQHQRAIGGLYVLLRGACPPHLEVFVVGTAYQPTRRRSVEPDLLVAHREGLGTAAVTAPLALAVEVVSPSTRSVDLLLKRGVYEESGVQSYWLVDPLEPGITAFDLVDGRFVEVGSAAGDTPLDLAHPFPVTVTPDLLVA